MVLSVSPCEQQVDSFILFPEQRDHSVQPTINRMAGAIGLGWLFPFALSPFEGLHCHINIDHACRILELVINAWVVFSKHIDLGLSEETDALLQRAVIGAGCFPCKIIRLK